MRNIKRALDPYWLMNPGKIFDYSSDSQPTKIEDLEAGRLAGAAKKDN
jgi:D-lactate dehydrogenase (cytochrome)